MRSPLGRCGVAVLCVAVTVGFALWLRPAVMAAGQLSLVAIVIAGWVCGLRPALLAWGLATLAFTYFFTPPVDSPRIDLAEGPRLAIFALLGLFMAAMSAARRSAEDSLETAREELKVRVRERTADLERSNSQLQEAAAQAIAAQAERQGHLCWQPSLPMATPASTGWQPRSRISNGSARRWTPS